MSKYGYLEVFQRVTRVDCIIIIIIIVVVIIIIISSSIIISVIIHYCYYYYYFSFCAFLERKSTIIADNYVRKFSVRKRCVWGCQATRGALRQAEASISFCFYRCEFVWTGYCTYLCQYLYYIAT